MNCAFNSPLASTGAQIYLCVVLTTLEIWIKFLWQREIYSCRLSACALVKLTFFLWLFSFFFNSQAWSHEHIKMGLEAIPSLISNLKPFFHSIISDMILFIFSFYYQYYCKSIIDKSCCCSSTIHILSLHSSLEKNMFVLFNSFDPSLWNMWQCCEATALFCFFANKCILHLVAAAPAGRGGFYFKEFITLLLKTSQTQNRILFFSQRRPLWVQQSCWIWSINILWEYIKCSAVKWPSAAS